jgi:hypothetical protein
MRRSLKVILAIGFVTAGLTALATYRPFGSVELPQPHRPSTEEVFPDLDYRAAGVGTSVDRIYGTFGKKPPLQGSAPAKRCVYFAYDPDLYQGALVVLVNDHTVQDRWLVTQAVRPAQCSGLPEETVDLHGWYAAALR